MNMRVLGPLKIFPDCHLWLAAFSAEVRNGPSQLANDLANARMDDKDLKRWERYRPLLKKQQFLSSRLAVRAVLDQEFGDFSKDVVFTTDVRGRPKISCSTIDEAYCISLSHSAQLIAVAISKGECSPGVDVEMLQPLRGTAFRHLITDEEIAWMQKTGEMGMAGAISAVWTIKEAVWKSLGGPDQLTASEITFSDCAEGLTSRILHPGFAGNNVQLKLFASEDILHLPAATRINTKWTESIRIPFVGCFARRANPSYSKKFETT